MFNINKKQIKLLFWLLPIIFVLWLVLFVASCSIHNNSNQTQTQQNTKPSTYVTSDNIVTTKTLGYQKRTPNKLFYETDLVKKYGEYGFKYPGWNHRYSEETKRYININNEKIDFSDKVYNEKVTYISNNIEKIVEYNNSDFITNQIENNSLKKHPYAKNAFEQEVLDSTPSITKEIKVNTTLRGYTSTGIYAPPGEIITIEFDEDTFKNVIRNTKNFEFVINENYNDTNAPNKKGEMDDRYPFLRTTFVATKKIMKIASPFGGAISIRMDTANISNYFNQNAKFTISGGVETLYFQNGVTSKKDWDEQIKRIKNNEITAPVFSGNLPLASFNVPFTRKNEIAYLNINDIIFPGEMFEKVNEFMYISMYINNSNYQKISMRFYDNLERYVYGFASPTWPAIHCTISYFKDTFLIGLKGFEYRTTWTVLHEFNHHFEPNIALFRKDHGFTCFASALIFSFISDQGRYRSEKNFNIDFDEGGDTWKNSNKMRSVFDLVNVVKNSKGSNDWFLNASISHLLGTRNMIEYIRDDFRNHPNSHPEWTPFSEVYRLSNYFKLNLWPLFKDYHKYWNDGWPSSEANATSKENAQITQLNNDYPAIDLVGNLYAAGSYIYDHTKKDFKYTNDNLSPYEIFPNQDYVFDFGNYINTLVEGFSWADLKFDSVSKNGIKIQKDPNNPNKLIYKASGKFSPKVDEFDVMITNISYPNKPNNYVPGYKWKIKVRQAIDIGPSVYSYSNIGSNESFENIISKVENNNVEKTWDFNLDKWRWNIFFQDNKVKNIKTKFIPPISGTYNFNAKWDGSVLVKMNGEQVIKSEASNPDTNFKFSKDLIRGEPIDIDIILKKTKSHGNIYLDVETIGKQIDIFQNSVYHNAEALGFEQNIADYLHKEEYRYIKRKTNSEDFPNNDYVDEQINEKIINPNSYRHWSDKYGYVENLKDFESGYFEFWSNGTIPGTAQSSFFTEFRTPTKINTFYFGHRTNNHFFGRPTHIEIIGYDESNESTTIYNDDYFGWTKHIGIIKVDANKAFKKIKINLTNKIYSAIILQWFRMSNI